MAADTRPPGFDGAAAVTRSLLGYGVVAGTFYLVVGVTLAATHDGFEWARHPLSLLMLGDHGWMQRANLILSGVMVAAAALGFARALRGSKLAAFVVAAWFAPRVEPAWSRHSRVSGVVALLGFVGGAALATRPAGVAALWVAVVAGWVWLAASSVRVYRTVPHPDPDRRGATAP